MSFVEKLFKLRIHSERHKKIVHLANLSFMSKALCCEFCEKTLELPSNIEIHMIIVHFANLSFISKALGCEFCGKNIQIDNPFRKTHENCSFG